MKLINKLILGSLLFVCNISYSQITGNGASTTQPTVYTDGSTNDVIYIYCVEPGTPSNIGSLTANPAMGTGPWDFEWFQYSTATNSFTPYSTDNNQASSTINNLPSGGYSVSIKDNTGAVVGCYNTWVFNNETILDAGTIGTSCGGFNLNGTVNPVADFIYYNPPPDQFIIDANTEITVCFDATHTWISDIGFFLVSPGGSVIELAPHPESINILNGCCCNSGDNVNNFCITTTPSGDLDVCGGMAPLTGTFSSYEGNVVDWSPIYGENAAESGWTVQIFDCIGGDIGSLTHASISFTGNSVCGPEVINYDSGNINSAIADNSCDQASASSFVVPPNPVITTPITLANSITSFQWTDDNPCVTIPNATTSLNPAIASTPTEDTWFYLTATDNFNCTYTDSVQFIRNCPCATNSPFIYLGANLTAPDCAAGTFDIVAGDLQFDEGMVPCTGTLTISTCSGDNVVFNAPFTSPIAFTIPDIIADGTTNCTIIAEFSDDPENCTIETGTFTEPECPCNIDSYNILIGSCQPVDNTYDLTGTIEFTNPPAVGTLVITIDNGTTTYDTIINAADFVSPLNFSISGVDSDAAASSVTATFSADGGCTATINYNAPADCYCSAEIGTFNTSMTGDGNTDYVLCFGDEFNYQSNGDFTPPDDVGGFYDPGIAYLIYSCPPTPGMTPDNDPVTGDPCVIGIVESGTGALLFNDPNDLGWINAFPPGTFTDNIIYYVPITMYDITNNFYSVAIEPCYELGPAVGVQYLPEIKVINVEDCQGGSITSTFEGGLPELNGSNFNVVPGSLTPANANFDNTSAANLGTITISGLTNGQAYQYSVIDDNGCPIIVSGTFIGTEDPGFSYNNYTICTAGTDPIVNITGDAGSFSYIATSGGPTLSLNTGNGAIDVSTSDPGTYDITFLTNDPTCFSDSTISMTINLTPIVNPIGDQTVCAGADFAAINFSGTPGTTFDWTNDDASIGLGINGSGNIPAYTAINGTTTQTSGTITVTPTLGTCVGTPTSFDLIVNPLDNPGFSYPAYTYCTSETDPTANIDVAGGTFTFTINNGGPTLVINPATGLIDLSATDAGSYDITYTTGGVCPQDSTITMNIAATPTVDPVANQTVCDESDFAIVDFTGSAGTTFNWVNNNIAIGLAANGTNDILAFTATNGTAAQISSTITVTPVAGTCTGTTTTFDLIVNPLDNPGFSYPAYTYCTSEVDPTAAIDVTGGAFTFTIVNGGPTLVINPATGLIDLSATDAGSYEISYTTSGVCPLDSTITMNVAATPTVDPVADQTVCDETDFALTDFTGSAGSTFNWANDNTNIGLAANGTNDIAIFTATNGTATQIFSTITVTPVAGSCTGTTTTFDLIVNPLDNPGFSYPTYTYCTTDVDPNATIDVAGGTFTFTATSGGPTLVIDAASGLIDLSASDEGIYDITYTTVGPCVQDSTITMTINFTPTIDIIADQTICHGTDFSTINFTGTSGVIGTTYDWTNDDNSIGLAANGTGDILGFTGSNLTTAQTSGLITVTPSNPSCVGTITTFNLSVNPLDNPGFSYPTYTYCTSETDPTATIDVAGGTFSFVATNGGPILAMDLTTGLIDLDASNAGTYDITYTTTGLCPQDSTITMNIASTPAVNAIADQTVCPLPGDEFNTVFISGSPGSTFNWVNDDITIGLATNGSGNILSFLGENIGLVPVTATITVTPVAGSCTGTPTDFTLTVNPLDNPGFSFPAYEYCTMDTPDPTASIDVIGGTFTAIPTVGVGNLSIDAATGLIDLDASDPGSYEITYTTAGLCPQDSTITMVINMTPVVNSILDQTVCENSSFNPVNYTGTAGATFNWANDNILTGLAANGVGNISSFNGSTSGGQEISTITVTPILGTCTGSDSIFQFIVNPLDDPGFSYPSYTYCTDDTPDPSATIDAAGGIFTFIATTGGPTLSIDPATGIIDLNTTNEGVYNITYTTQGICPQDSTVSMTINFTPTVDAVLDQTICHGTDFIDVIFNGTAGALPTTFDWTNDNVSIGLGANGNGDILAFTADNNTAAQTTGIITVTPSNTACSGTSTTFNYNVNPLDDPSFEFVDGLTYCATAADPVGVITGTAGGTFSFTVNSGGPILTINTTTGDVDLATSNTGSYDITYTTTGVCPQSSTLTLVITDAPIANFSFMEYCQLDTDPMPNYSNDDQGTAFPLTGSGGMFSEPTGLLSINPATGEVDLGLSTPGSYTITNTINLPGCAVANASDDIVIYQMPTVSISGDGTFCPDALLPDLEINVVGTDPTWTIIYEYDGSVQPFIASQTLPLIIPNAPFGSYEIVSVSDGHCTSIVSETVEVNSYPVVSIQAINNYSVCEGDNLTIDQFIGDPTGNTFDWNVISGSDIGFGTSGSGSIGTFTANTPQTVTVEVTPTSSLINGSCVGDPTAFDIMVNPLPVVDFIADNLTGCEPTSIEFTNLSTNGNTYVWDFGDGTTGTGSIASHTYQFAGIYDVGLSVTSSEGCTSSATEIGYISITPTPVAAFSFTPNQTDISHPEVQFTNSSIDGDYYEWNFGDDSPLNNETDPIHNYIDEPDQYHITLLVTNNNGLCRDSVDAYLTIEDIIVYYVPNVFTPDQDEFNETFKPIFTAGFDPFNYHLMIFNRWGELIFESYDASIGWDGTYPQDGKLCQDGVYVWKIDFKETMSDKRHDLTGHVTLLK